MITTTLVLLDEDYPKLAVTCGLGPADENAVRTWFSLQFNVPSVGQISLLLPYDKWFDFTAAVSNAFLNPKPSEEYIKEEVTSERSDDTADND